MMKMRFSACAAVVKTAPATTSAANRYRIVDTPVPSPEVPDDRNADNAWKGLRRP